jgi:hypothetical protein
MARRSMAVADLKEILVQWDAGEGVSSIARTLGYTRPTVRKYPAIPNDGPTGTGDLCLIVRVRILS